MAYADYEYYTAAYLGKTIQKADFPRLSLRASYFLDYYTQGPGGLKQRVGCTENGLLRRGRTVPEHRPCPASGPECS